MKNSGYFKNHCKYYVIVLIYLRLWANHCGDLGLRESRLLPVYPSQITVNCVKVLTFNIHFMITRNFRALQLTEKTIPNLYAKFKQSYSLYERVRLNPLRIPYPYPYGLNPLLKSKPLLKEVSTADIFQKIFFEAFFSHDLFSFLEDQYIGPNTERGQCIGLVFWHHMVMVTLKLLRHIFSMM